MYPHERSLVKKLEGKPFVLLGVNSDRDIAKLRPRLAEEKITWRSFWNGPEGPRGPIAARWNVSGWPRLYLIDAKGVIRRNRLRPDEIDAAVERVLAEMSGE